MIDGRWPRSLWAEERRSIGFPEVDVRSQFDVAIVGAGYTGMWSAILLKELRPDLDIVVLDAVEPGFGASGRNGGWCSGLFPVEMPSLEAMHGRGAAVTMQRAAIKAVDDVGHYVESHGIACDWTKSGTLTVATNTAHVERLKAILSEQRAYGFDDEDMQWLSADDLAERIAVAGAHGATFSPHCAAIHPMKLVNGLVDRMTTLGIRVLPGFRASAITEHGVSGALNGRPTTIHSEWVVRATEGYTSSLRGEQRTVIPLYSFMVATEPLDDDAWRDIRWSARETIAEAGLMVTYAQRTADGRIAFGGRGARYRYAGRIDSRFDTDDATRGRIEETLHRLFPATQGTRITHHWGGPLAVPRDWHPSVSIDSRARRVSAGGYVGDGVALSHLAGRTVAAAIAGVDSPDLRLPLVRSPHRRWEPEPLRWIGVNAGLRLPLVADALEARTGRPARRMVAVLDRLLG